MDIVVIFSSLVIYIFFHERWKQDCATKPIKHFALVLAQASFTLLTCIFFFQLTHLLGLLNEELAFCLGLLSTFTWFYWGTVFHREVEEDDF